MKLFIFIVLLFIAGCSQNMTEYSFSPIISPHKTDFIVLDSPFNKEGVYWLISARKYFDDPLVVMGHGINNKVPWYQINGEKDIVSVEILARALHQIYPKRDIVLIICNSEKQDLDIDRVYYPKDIVWTLPDEFAQSEIFGVKYYQHETIKNYGYVGNIEEFYYKGKQMSVKKIIK